MILDSLCAAVAKGEHDGDICARLCVDRNFTISDFYEGGSKKVIKLNEEGKDVVLKVSGYSTPSFSQIQPHPLKMDRSFEHEYPDYVDPRVSDEEFTDKVSPISHFHCPL